MRGKLALRPIGVGVVALRYGARGAGRGSATAARRMGSGAAGLARGAGGVARGAAKGGLAAGTAATGTTAATFRAVRTTRRGGLAARAEAGRRARAVIAAARGERPRRWPFALGALGLGLGMGLASGIAAAGRARDGRADDDGVRAEDRPAAPASQPSDLLGQDIGEHGSLTRSASGRARPA